MTFFVYFDFESKALKCEKSFKKKGKKKEGKVASLRNDGRPMVISGHCSTGHLYLSNPDRVPILPQL